MNEKRRRFAEAYVIEGEIVSAAISAGYSETFAKKKAYLLLENAEVKAYIDKLLAKIESKKIAKPKEVMEYLTSVMRGESKAEEIVVEGCGLGCSEARTMIKRPSENQKLKAASELFKRFDAGSDNEIMKKLDQVLGDIDVIAHE